MKKQPMQSHIQVRSFFMTKFIFLFLLLPSLLFAQRAIPEHGGVWVRDEANVLSPQTVSQLEYYLKAHRDSTSNQIAVYVIPSLNGEDIDDYAVQVFKKWELGQKGKDNGVLLLISIQDRLVRTEVGYGLEGVLTDLMSSRINRNEIARHFRTGDYDGGVSAGVSAIIQVIKGEYVNDEPVSGKRTKKRSPLFTVIMIFLLIIFLSRRRGGRGGGGGYWSSGGGFIGPLGGGGFGSSSGSWGSSSGGDFGGGGFSGGGGSSDSW
jgi:uncharacterized protein